MVEDSHQSPLDIPELFSKILDHVRDDATTMINIACVKQLWFECVVDILWKRTTFFRLFNVRPDRRKLYTPSVTQLIVNWDHKRDTGIGTADFHGCKFDKLVQLTLSLDKIVLEKEARIGFKFLEPFLTPTLTRLIFYNCYTRANDDITKMVIDRCEQLKFVLLPYNYAEFEIIKELVKLPHLQSMLCKVDPSATPPSDFKIEYGNLSKLQIKGTAAQIESFLSPKLTHLDLLLTGGNILPEVTRLCTGLEHFRLSGGDRPPTSTEIVEFSKANSSLQSLYLSDYQIPSDDWAICEWFRAVMRNFPILKELTMGGNIRASGLPPEVYSILSHCCPLLEFLDLKLGSFGPMHLKELPADMTFNNLKVLRSLPTVPCEEFNGSCYYPEYTHCFPNLEVFENNNCSCPSCHRFSSIRDATESSVFCLSAMMMAATI